MMDRLVNLSAREFFLATGILLGLFGYGLYTAIVEPEVVNLNSASAKLGSQEELLNIKRMSAAKSVVHEKKAARLREELKNVRAAYYTSGEAAALLAGLSQLAATADCRLLQVDFESEDWLEVPDGLGAEAEGAEAAEADAPDSVKRTVLSLFLRGRYDGMIALLRTLEERPGYIHVGHLSMEVVDPESAELNATCVLTVFSKETRNGEGS